ncbi:DUF3862 domain-containing protein [Lactiplantibacillus modestisalitolerans]|uniref:DUF3862 domain-containing protein n=1 Tax=Lactiplantibacillus modestisalitolerans TaxID=1457219 RepID=A0ABV5WSN2_9LACO|nr:DUF3862 domain-containing protein [Lactiplantibacillus modestisalitolerans]
MQKFITLLGVALLAVIVAACQSQATPPVTQPNVTRVASTKASQPTPKVSLTNFSRIQVAIKAEDHASSIEQVRALFGKPDQIQTTTNDGQTVKHYVWTETDSSLAGADVHVWLIDGTVVDKAYHHAEFGRNRELTQDALTKLETGSTIEKVIARFGPPNAVAMAGTAHDNTQILTYRNIQALPQTEIGFVFKQNQLTATLKNGQTMS